MKSLQRILIPLAVVGLLFCFLVPTVTCNAETKAQPAVEAQADSPNTEAAPAAKVEKKSADRLTRREKRELGILPRQVLSKARQMAKDGDITKDMSYKEMAFCYAAEVADSPEYGGAWKQINEGKYGVDWDGIIEFLEKLFELLIKFIPIFM